MIKELVATEYVVKSGDTLTTIAEQVGFTTIQLTKMNDELTDVIVVGQKIRYFNDYDVCYAKLWCKKQLTELSRKNEYYNFYLVMLKNLENKVFRFSVEEPNGIHFSNIFIYAEAWRRQI